MSINHLRIGTAGEFIVCADLMLGGHVVYLAMPGSIHDLLTEVRGRFLRIAVKSTGLARSRPSRASSAKTYIFNVGRTRRLKSGKTDNRGYTTQDIDIVALCALDVKATAYVHISECARAMQFEPLGATDEGRTRRGMIPGRTRKKFEQYTFGRAIAVHFGEVSAIPLKKSAAPR